MAFSSWSQELSNFKDYLAAVDPSVRRYRTPDGTEIERHDLKAVQAHLGFLQRMASNESAGTGGAAPRKTSAIPRGNW